MATGSAPPNSERAPNSAEASGGSVATVPHAGTSAGRILANTFFRGLADVGSKIVSLAFFVAMARLLGQEGFGIFTFGLAYATIVTVLAGFGQDAVLTRAVARDQARVHEYFANTIVLKLVVALPILFVATAGEWVLGMDRTTRIASLLLALGMLAELLTGTCFGVYQAYERLGFMPVVLVFQRLVTAGAGIAAMVLGAQVVAVSAIYVVGAVGALVLAYVLMSRNVVRPALRVEPGRWLPLMRSALPVGVALVLAVILFRVDAAILKFLKPIAVVGQYGAAYRLFESTLFLGWAVGAAVFPVLSRAEDLRAMRLIYERALKLVLALTAPAAVGAAVLGGPLIDLLYGHDFSKSARPLAILAPTIVFASVNHISAVLLLARDRQRFIAVGYGILAVENIAANFALIPWLSLNGAALNTTLTEVLLVATVTGYALRLTGGADWRRLVTGPAAATLVSTGAMLLLRGHVGAALVAGVAAYAVVLAVVESVAYPEDARTVWGFVRGRGSAVAA